MNGFQKIFFRLSVKEKMLFARDMEVMIRSGMQIIESLELFKKQVRSKTFKAIIDQLILDVKNGQFLSTSLERYEKIFGAFFINLIRVGETSGTLAENFDYLADELKKNQELKRKISGAMVYPIIILIATFGITGLLTFFIFPKILPVLKSINVELPAITLAFIAISEFLLKYGLHTVAGIIGLVVLFELLLKIPAFRFRWHSFLLRIPIIGGLIKAINIVSFARTLSILLRGGVKIIESITITSNTLTNLVYRREVEKIAEAVGKGEQISKHLVANPRLFPPIFSQMILVGETTGKLDESALFLSNFYESELDETTKTMSNVLEPMLLLVMGVIVGFVALSIITPIYKITQGLGR